MSHWNRRSLYAAAALAAALAAPAYGQMFGRRPAPAPKQPTAEQQAQQAQAASPGAPADVQQKLQQVRDTAQNAVAIAKIAQSKAQLPAVKDLANKVAADWQPLVQQAEQIAAERGMKLTGPSAEAKSALDASTKQLNALSGAGFDRAFVDGETGHFEVVEQHLKDLREATPGEDARLKKWLDDSENVAEKSLADSRDAKSQFQQVQGRSGR